MENTHSVCLTFSHSPSLSPTTTGEDPGLWFGSSTGRGSGKHKFPSGVQGQSPGRIWGQSPQKPKECYTMRLKKPLTKRKKASPYRLTLYDNIIIIIISSTHRFLIPAIFVLKYKTATTSVCGATVQLVLCNLRYSDTQAIALGGQII